MAYAFALIVLSTIIASAPARKKARSAIASIITLSEGFGIIPMGTAPASVLDNLDAETLKKVLNYIKHHTLLRSQGTAAGGYNIVEGKDVTKIARAIPKFAAALEAFLQHAADSAGVPRSAMELRFMKLDQPGSGVHAVHQDGESWPYGRWVGSFFFQLAGSEQVGIFSHFYRLSISGLANTFYSLPIFHGSCAFFVPAVGFHGVPELPEGIMRLTLIAEVDHTKRLVPGSSEILYNPPRPFEPIKPVIVSKDIFDLLAKISADCEPSDDSARQAWKSQLARRWWNKLHHMEANGTISGVNQTVLDEWRDSLSNGTDERRAVAYAAAGFDEEEIAAKLEETRLKKAAGGEC